MAPPGKFPQSPLRYRRFGGGYRSEDVELVLAECRLAVRQLERRVAPLRERERELQVEVDALRRELATLRTRQRELGGQVEAALSHSAKVEQLARDQSTWANRVGDAEPLPEGAPSAAAMSGRPATEFVRLNEELLASAQTLEAQLRHADETLRGQPSLTAEPEAEPEAPGEPMPAPAAEPEQPVAEAEPERPEEPERIRVRPDVVYDELSAERPAAPIFVEGPSRRRAAADVLALREELSALELRRARATAVAGYSPALVIGIVAAGLATAVGLAVAGYGTAAVILLAAYALAIAAISVYGRPAAATPALRPEPIRAPFGPPRPVRATMPDRAAPIAPEEAEAEPEPEPVPVFDPAEAQRELAQLARERARRLVELGDAVEVGDDAAAAQARARLRELDALIASKEAELEAGPNGNGFSASLDGEGWRGESVTANSHSER